MKQNIKNSNGIICKKLPFKGFGHQYANVFCNLEYKGVRCTEQLHGLQIIGKNKNYAALTWSVDQNAWGLYVMPPSKWDESVKKAVPVISLEDWRTSDISYGPAPRITIEFTCGEHKGKQTYLDLKIEPPISNEKDDSADRSSNFEGSKTNNVGKHSGNEENLEIYENHPTSNYIYGWPRNLAGLWIWTWNLNHTSINYVAYKNNGTAAQQSIIEKMNRYIQSELLTAINDYNESIVDSNSIFKDENSRGRYGDSLSYHCHNRFQIVIKNYIDRFYKSVN